MRDLLLPGIGAMRPLPVFDGHGALDPLALTAIGPKRPMREGAAATAVAEPLPRSRGVGAVRQDWGWRADTPVIRAKP
ncbi:MAG: hypothetical protein MZW92_13045 [Comamonadaceae bacterium]|nr:hypothetical protein [Comamonadaceae bacterium]